MDIKFNEGKNAIEYKGYLIGLNHNLRDTQKRLMVTSPCGLILTVSNYKEAFKAIDDHIKE